METLNISSKLYDYSVDFIDHFADTLKTFDPETTAFVIDGRVYELYREQFCLTDESKVYFMEAAEQKKNMDTVMEIISFWQKLGVRKNWKVVCIGGGITQDVTTIASNLFLRNVEWYFFPTTLLSMCDSCIGGKCGINVGEYKNQIGVFYPPKKIFIDVRFIDTLSRDDYINGWGELLKFSLTNDPDFYEELKSEERYIPCEKIAYYIHKGLGVKKKVIEEDEFESDLRRILNYGHTFGHALEAYTHHAVPHGKGVIWGIDVVNYIAWKKNLIAEELYREIKALIRRAFLPEEIAIDKPGALFDIIRTDKKVKGNMIHLAVLDGPSHLIVYPVPLGAELEQLFESYVEETHEYYRH